jgi:hypothetical protein
MEADDIHQLLEPDFNNGAIPALRGYRVQFLDTLRRVLQSGVGEIVCPELKEDYSVVKDNILTEVVQVKNLGSPLVISSLSPTSEDSFFNRCIGLLDKAPAASFKLVSVGELGGDFQDLAKGDSSTIYHKLVDNYGYDEEAAKFLTSRLEIVVTTEAELLELVKELLDNTVVGGDVDTALDLLHFWMYQLAEKQQSASREDVIRKYSEVGLFLNERRQYLQQFGRSVLPLSSEHPIERGGNQELQLEYFSGVAARYKHIQAGLDLRRPVQIHKIRNAFEKSSTVLVHGASGQGKSTLSYRYAHDHYPAGYAFEVILEEGDAWVLDIRQAVTALARPFSFPFLLLLDVPPGNESWVFLAKQLTDIPNCHVLVTIREEDLNRSSSVEEFTRAVTVKLDLRKLEAEELFSRLRKQGVLSDFLGFTDAWSKFGEEGPFLEFAYLLRSGERLRDRLQNQLSRLRDEASVTGNRQKINLLQLVVFAGAHDCRLDLRLLVEAHQNTDYQLVIQHLKDEYMVRTSLNGQYVEALHPIRARLMMDLMLDPILMPRATSLAKTLPYVVEADLGNFVLQYGHHCGWNTLIQKALSERHLYSWQVAKEIFRSLIWCGVKEFISKHRETFDKLHDTFPMAKEIAMLLHFAPGSNMSTVSSLFPADRLATLEEILSGFAHLDTAYVYAFKWLGVCSLSAPVTQLENKEVDGLGYVAYWMGRSDNQDQLGPEIIKQISLEEGENVSLLAWANLLLGLHTFGSGASQVIKEMTPRFVYRLQTELSIVSFQEMEDEIEIGVLIDGTDEIKKDEDKEQEPWHKRVISALELVRKAFPTKDLYTSQGYGQLIREFAAPHDPTHKRLSKETLRPAWETDNFQFLLNLTKWQDRPNDWEDFVEGLAKKHEEVRQLLLKTKAGIKKISKRRRIKGRTKVVLDITLPRAQLPLPKVAVDELGFTGDSIGKLKEREFYHSVPLLLLLMPALPEAVKSIKDFYTPLQSFVIQADKSIQIKEVTAGWKANELQSRAQELAKSGYDYDNLHLSVYNLNRVAEYVLAYEDAINMLRKQLGTWTENLPSLVATVEELHLLWLCFTKRPLSGGYDLARAAEAAKDKVLDDIYKRLDDRAGRLSKRIGASGHEVVFSETGDHDWYVFFSVKDRAAALNIETAAIDLVKESVGKLKHRTFARDVVEENLGRIWVIPIYGSYIITRQAVSFKLYDVTGGDTAAELTAMHYMTPITDATLKESDLREAKQVFPAIEKPDLLVGEIRKIMIWANHLGQLSRVPEPSEVGKKVLGKQIDKVLSKIDGSFPKLQDLLQACADNLSGRLNEGAEWLAEIDVILLLESLASLLNEYSEVTNDLEDLKNASEKLTRIDEWAEELYDYEQEIGLLHGVWLNSLLLDFVDEYVTEE